MIKFFYLTFFTISFAQTISDYSYTGAKTTALAGAVVSDKNGSESIFHNPASITEVDHTEIFMGSGNLYGYNWLPTYYLHGIISRPILGKIGFAIQQFETKYGDVILSQEQTVSIAQGFNLQKDKNSHLAIGYTANFIRWDLGNSAGISGDGIDGQSGIDLNVITIDFGILANLREKYRFGMLIKNINSGSIGKNMNRQILPRRINVGVTYRPIPELFTTISAERILGNNNLQIRGSVRYQINSFFELYSGAQSNPNRFGFGCKFIIKNYAATYSLLTHPILPITQQLSIGFKL